MMVLTTILNPLLLSDIIMRSLVVLFVLIGTPHALPSQLHAEDLPPPRRVGGVQRDDCCEGLPPQCGRPTPQANCGCQPCCRKRLIVVKQPCDEGLGDENAPIDESAPVNPGAFVTPPANGRVYEESGSRGISGLKIRFPELTLSLPSIELPSCFSYREKAHMRTNESVAPYMSMPTANVVARGGGNESARVDDDSGGDESAEDEEEALKGDVEKCEAQIQRLEQIEKRVSQQLLEMSHVLQQLNGCPPARQAPNCPPRPEQILTPLPTAPPCYPGQQMEYTVPVFVEPAPYRYSGELRRLPPVTHY
jgi:hypothetical protein